MKTIRLVLVAAIGLAGTAAPAGAQILALSNTPVTHSQVLAFFAINGPGLVAITDGNAAGIHINTRVWQGTAGTAAEGHFLYDFWIEGTDSTLRGLTVPVASRIDFDLDANATPDSSAYCTDCTTFPVPTAPSSASQSPNGVTFGFASGVTTFSSELYFLSDVAPGIVSGTLVFQGTGSFPIQVLPEPRGSAASAAALLSVAALAGRARFGRGRRARGR